MANSRTGSDGSQTTPTGSVEVGLFQLSSNDHPSIAIVTAPFIGSNYLTWSTSIQILLGANDKLGFIDGSVQKPNEGTVDFQKWRRVDYRVRSWILGSLTKKLAESFVYCSTAKISFEELKERFGERNGPQIYKIQREIASIQ